MKDKIIKISRWKNFFRKKKNELKPYNTFDDGVSLGLSIAYDWIAGQSNNKQGEWIDLKNGNWKCSSCEKDLKTAIDVHPIHDLGLFYCFNCGSPMTNKIKKYNRVKK